MNAREQSRSSSLAIGSNGSTQYIRADYSPSPQINPIVLCERSNSPSGLHPMAIPHDTSIAPPPSFPTLTAGPFDHEDHSSPPGQIVLIPSPAPSPPPPQPRSRSRSSAASRMSWVVDSICERQLALSPPRYECISLPARFLGSPSYAALGGPHRCNMHVSCPGPDHVRPGHQCARAHARHVHHDAAVVHDRYEAARRHDLHGDVRVHDPQCAYLRVGGLQTAGAIVL